MPSTVYTEDALLTFFGLNGTPTESLGIYQTLLQLEKLANQNGRKCASMCKAGLFGLSIDIAEGKPTDSCEGEASSTASNAAAVSLALGFSVLLTLPCVFGVCTPYQVD